MPDWLCLELQLSFFFFLLKVCDQCTLPQQTSLFLTPTLTLGLSLLCAAQSWNLAFPGHTHHICWTNKIIPDHNLWGETNERNIKWLILALKAKPLQLFAVHWKCGVSRVNLKTLTITQIIACSFCPPQFFSIMLSWSKHSLPQTKPAWLKNGWVYSQGLWSRLGSDWRDLRER